VGVKAADADKSAWPLLRPERRWGPWRLAITLATAAAATWCYLIGEYTGYYLSFARGGLALAAGSMIGMLLVLLAAGPTCIRFGIESVAASKPQFGSRGWILPAAMQLVSIIGWNSLLLIFFAKSTTQLLIVLGLLPGGVGAAQVVPATTALACLLVFVVLQRGASGVARISNFLVAHVGIGLWMLYLLVSQRWPELAAARPALAAADPLWNYTTGVEIGISAILSWWPYLGAMVRMAPNGRTIALPVMLGMGAPVPLLSLIGIAGILVLKVSDPSAWLRSIGGPVYAVIALLFVAAANLGTAIAGIYASAIGLRNFASAERLPWSGVLLVTIAPVALVGLLVPELFFAKFGVFLAFIGVGFAPLCGIQIVDYYLLRRGAIDIRAIYDRRPGSPYHYWGGVNPAAVLSLLLGCGVYVALLNPLTYASAGPYRFLTASLPTAFVSAVAFWLLSRVLVLPAGRGGYRATPQATGSTHSPYSKSTDILPSTWVKLRKRPAARDAQNLACSTDRRHGGVVY
jgi:nucleobase:cation symporter-1, NCS1 family